MIDQHGGPLRHFARFHDHDRPVARTQASVRRTGQTPASTTSRRGRGRARGRRARPTSRVRHVVIVGGGFVGCELACTAREHGMDVTLVLPSA
ncbi:FAD-dependent oxidoreductase [Yinghuangia seranimata]|uniref:FAD-dependent oxidoreductase n=1 Tax=Yinghuangia seranimata TaxID=408067 RepID=UPI00248C9C3E|nr:FAD-dependent oxidoreductase [Yinghuangia seranimata]MDI2131292.1 NAD-binding protein [Yinghuangia seranimata]